MTMTGPGASNPSYLAYLRALGFQEDTARAVALRNIAAINRQVQTQLPEIARLGAINRARIGDSFEARGVFRSGMRQQRQAEQGASELYRVGALQGNAADRIGAQQSGLDSTLADLARQRAERQATLGIGV